MCLVIHKIMFYASVIRILTVQSPAQCAGCIQTTVLICAGMLYKCVSLVLCVFSVAVPYNTVKYVYHLMPLFSVRGTVYGRFLRQRRNITLPVCISVIL